MAESFIFYETFAKQLDCLDDVLQLKFYKAIIRYGLYNEKPEFTDLEACAWFSIQEAMDASKKKTGKQRKVSRNEAIPDEPFDPRKYTKTLTGFGFGY